jgi:hypothetical protein
MLLKKLQQTSRKYQLQYKLLNNAGRLFRHIVRLCFSISEKTKNIVTTDTKCHGTDVALTLREKYVTVPDVSERAHYNICQRYFLAVTLTELSGHVTDKGPL